MVPIPMYTKASFRGNDVPICFPENRTREPFSPPARLVGAALEEAPAPGTALDQRQREQPAQGRPNLGRIVGALA